MSQFLFLNSPLASLREPWPRLRQNLGRKVNDEIGEKKKNKVCLSTCQTGTELVKTAIWERNALKVIECFPNIWYVKFNDLRSVLYRCTKVGYFTKRTLWTALTLKTVKTGRRSSTVYPSHYLSGWRLREISKWCYSVFRFCTLAHSKADIIKFKSGCLAFVVLRFIHPLSKWTFIPKGEKYYHI